MFVQEAPTPIGCDPAALPLERIEHEIEELAAHINAGSAHWLELVAEFDRREGWGGTGCRSCSEWIAWRCGLNPRAAREHVR
ncbi:MAG: HNH endonuclease, partial [Solirubrobacterales bacterium]